MANYAGQNLGANRIDRIKEGVRKCTYLTLIFSIVATVVVYIFSKPILMLFNIEDNTAIMSDALYYLKTTSLFYPALALLFIHRNVLQGIGRSFMPLMAGVFELFARSIAALVLPGLIGYAGVCLAGPAAWFAAAIPLAISYVVIIKQVEQHYVKPHKLRRYKEQ
jgi:Na+-driven multidrug efflux pump